jgi:hypothetical protein
VSAVAVAVAMDAQTAIAGGWLVNRCTFSRADSRLDHCVSHRSLVRTSTSAVRRRRRRPDADLAVVDNLITDKHRGPLDGKIKIN